MVKLRALSRRENALRIVFPLAIIMPTTIAWAGDVNNPANDSLLAMPAQRQAKILGKIADDGCKGKTAFYQGTMKNMPQPEGHRPPQLPVPAANENDTFWNVMCKNGRSYSIEVHPDQHTLDLIIGREIARGHGDRPLTSLEAQRRAQEVLTECGYSWPGK